MNVTASVGLKRSQMIEGKCADSSGKGLKTTLNKS